MSPKVHIIALSILALTSCRGNGPKQAAETEPVPIHRLDRAPACARDSAAMLTLLDIFNMSRSDTLTIDSYLNSSAMKVFGPDIAVRLPALNDAEMQLGHIRAVLSEKLPQAYFSEIYGVVNPYYQTIIVADSLVYIGLNHYLGPDYPGYESFDSYIRNRKSADRIPYDAAEAVITAAYPYSPSADCAVINRILYEGALLKAVTEAVADADTQSSLGYSADEMNWVETYEADIWKTLISRNLLYSMSQADEAKLVNPSPGATIIHPEAPSATGRFIGLKIVDSYMRKHPDATLHFLLSPAFYCSPATLVESGYSP